MSIDDTYWWLGLAEVAVIFGVILEGIPSVFKFCREAIVRNGWRSAVIKSLHHWDELVSLIGASVVAIALMGELHFSSSAQTDSLNDLRETQRTQSAMIDQLKPRRFTKAQFDGFVAALAGKLKTVRVFLIPDPEAYSFGLSVMTALTAAHIGEYETDLKSNDNGPISEPNTGVTWYISPTDPNKALLVPILSSSCKFIPNTQCSVSTPLEPLAGVSSPSLFVLSHPLPLNFIPSWYASGMPKSPWEGAPQAVP